MGLSSLVFQFISISNKLSYVGLWGISSRAEVSLFSHCKHLIEQRGIEREGSLEQTMGEDLARENERLKQKSIVSSMVRMMPPHPAAPPPCAPRLASPSPLSSFSIFQVAFLIPLQRFLQLWNFKS